MSKTEKRWLLSVLMAVAMVFTLMAQPMLVSAADNALPKTVTYVNSDGEEIASNVTDDGFVWHKTSYEDQEYVEILGYRGDATKLEIPAQIDGTAVKSFAIDPRWPVWDELYDQVTSISLPASVQFAHSKYMRFFQNLESVSIAEGGDYYMSENGVLYKYNEEGCELAVYPNAKADTTYTMPDSMNEMGYFPEGCPIEVLNVSKSMKWITGNYLTSLSNLKEANVDKNNPTLYSRDGVLFEIDQDEEEDEETGEIQTETWRALIYYPPEKSGSSYTVPDDTTDISDLAFQYNTIVKEITLPESVGWVSDYVFDDTNIDKVIFLSAAAPEIKHFDRYWGLRERMEELHNALQIEYPAGAEGYEDFIEWMKGKNFNYWWDEPYLEYEEIPVGSNRSPIYGIAENGNDTKYTVYSKTENGTYSKERPDTAGTWYAKLVVDETEDYAGLMSEPFAFEVVAVEGQQENHWISYPDDIWVTQGEEILLDATPLYGQIDQVIYYDDEGNELDGQPTKPGTYTYKLTVNEKEGAYDGLLFISSENDVWIYVESRFFECRLECSDILKGETPNPVVTPYEDEEYPSSLDWNKITFEYYTYDEEEEDDVLVDDITKAEPGEYDVVARYEGPDFKISEWESFTIFETKAELLEARISDLGKVKYLDERDEEEVNEVKAMYDSLTASEKEDLDEASEAKLQKAIGRVAAAKANLALHAAQESYQNAQAAYTEAAAKAAASEAAAIEAAAAGGKTAADAAAAAAKDAADAAAAAAKLEEAAKAASKAQEDAAAAAWKDPLATRLDAQNADRASVKAEQAATEAAAIKKDADAKAEAAKKYAEEQASQGTDEAENYKVAGFKVKALKKGKAQATWKANTNASGYQIQYSLKKNMKKAKVVNVKKATAKKATLKKLKKGKKYFVRIRTCTVVTDPATGQTSNVYGKWSAKKKVKAK